MFKSNLFYNRLKSRSMLIKLLLSSLGIAILSVLIITSLFTYWIKQEGENAINSATELALSNINTLSSNMFESSKKIAYEIYNNINVKNMLLYEKNKTMDAVFAANYITDLTVSNSFIFSISICNSNSIMFQTSQKAGFDESYKDLIKTIRNGPILQPIPRKIKGQDGEVINLFTIIYHAFSSGDDNIDSIVVINIKVESLYDQVYSTFLKQKQNILLIDKSGNILLHNNMDEFSKNISNEPFFNRAIRSDKNSGFFNLKLGSKYFVYNYFLEKDKKYLVISVSDYNAFFNKVTQTETVIIFTCLIILLLITFISVFLSYKLYTPINNVFLNIRTLFKDSKENEGQLTEAKLVSQAFSNLVMKLNNFENDNQNNFQIMRNDFIKNLLISENFISDASKNEDMKKYKIFDEFEGDFCIVVFRIDNFKAFYNNNTKEAIHFQLNSMGNLVCDYLKPFCHCILCEIDSEHIVVIVKTQTSKANLSTGTVLIDSLKICNENIAKLFNLQVTIGVSEFSCELSLLKEKYTQAFSFTNYRLNYGKGSILTINDIRIEEIKNDKLAYLIDASINSIKSNSLDSYTDYVHLLFSTMERCSYEKIVKIFFQLANSILRMPIDMQPNGTGSFEYDFEEVYKQIKSFEDYLDLETWFVYLFNQTYNIILNIRNKKTPDLIEKVIRYINENYGDKDISSNLMAEKLNITPQYFSKIFNEFIDISFPDYVNNVRMEKAKELLSSNSKLSIGAIFDKIGYNNRTYFTSSFTKKYGISPAKFKNNSSFDKLDDDT